MYDRYLYSDDLMNLIPENATPEDSIQIVKNFIENWIRHHVVLRKAEDNLPAESKNVQKQLDEYRNSLIMYAYERELIRQNLDTVVSDDEIQKYYDDNPNNFELKDNIVKAFYFQVNSNAPKLDKVRLWFRSDKTKDRQLLDEYCHQFASDFSINDETWILFDDLLKKVPLKTYDKEQFLKNNRYVEITDSNRIYFVHIKGFMIKEGLSPLSFERDNIRDIIINKRKLRLVQEMEKVAYEEALRNSDFEIISSKENE